MGTTPKYRLPYPEPGDRPAGDAQIKALAVATDTAIGSAPAPAAGYWLGGNATNDMSISTFSSGTEIPLAARFQDGASVSGGRVVLQSGLWVVQVTMLFTAKQGDFGSVLLDLAGGLIANSGCVAVTSSPASGGTDNGTSGKRQVIHTQGIFEAAAGTTATAHIATRTGGSWSGSNAYTMNRALVTCQRVQKT
ncbi:hypothetical protein DY218_27250 [Streptomyces triticagri]|uniref:Uncharacterized protein n=1 Tax=Streptomyces triticagri TaxID=2293568 RepID=A0A372LZZ2_9ACTN|nr:hypothetical protein [Streptomyces triticagri]RFU83607.1 hypothetical protein DY218_27250 [Streptomyces triticagri]